MLSHLCQILFLRFRLVQLSIIYHIHIHIFDSPLSCLFDTSSCSLYVCYYCNRWRCPKDTCFSDLLLTARSVDNGGLRLCTVVLILSLCLYAYKEGRKKIIEKQKKKGPCKRRYPSLNYWFILFSLSCSLCFIDRTLSASLSLCFSCLMSI